MTTNTIEDIIMELETIIDKIDKNEITIQDFNIFIESARRNDGDLQPIEESDLTEIYRLIDDKSLTVDRLNEFIKESNEKSIRNRVHRKTRKSPLDSHVDNVTGRQPLIAGKFSVAERTHPKHHDPHQQEHGAAEAGHERSTETQRKNAEKSEKETAVEML